ncbi:hypothetical protein H6G93_37835 [Nostoc sp. FACHB-973]|uniref:Uncharacterized protein n=1 Tax=Desmonostoc muscorum LEGE 12446 TaxID=1828758 RepID=A0A8J6ZUA0_DESMC|nr:hypothetical protein [Desmonostoc muscorum]MBD2520605.1 hypothetical protein [Nostoc sp. FACHB-973]MBX9254720.1 hypothetical protein [Desmonostoc muscorum CCALA 125]MCF2148064.1 hypothetical protein [Desmonostoc muscorum LEGE 12446]
MMDAIVIQYGSVKPPDGINRRQDERLILVETAIYRVFGSRIFIKKP